MTTTQATTQNPPLRQRTQQLDRALLIAGYAFAAGSTIHVVDHLRRGQDSVSEPLFWLGNLGLIVQVVVVTLVVTHHRRAPDTSFLGGIPLAVGFTAVHWLPHWSILSDPVWEIPTGRWFSYIASLAEIAGATAVAALGLIILWQRSTNETQRW